MLQRTNRHASRILMASALMMTTWPAEPSMAASLEVTSTDDSGAGTLREALTLAEANGEADTVTFAVTGTIVLASTLPTISTDVDIEGPGAALLTLSGGGAVRVLRFAGGTVVIRDLTIADGLASGENGGTTTGWRAGGGGGGLGAGGGIYAQDALVTLEALVFVGNQARGGDGGDGGPGSNIAFPGGLGGEGGASSDEVLSVTDAISDGDPAMPTVTLVLAEPLPDGLLRLVVCPAAVDLEGNPVDGDGDGVGGDPFLRTFRIDRDNLFANGHLDGCPVTLAPWQGTVTPPDEVVASDEDADGSSLSGSARVMSVTAAASILGQCIDGVTDVHFVLRARARLDAQGNATATMTAFCEAFDGAACTGTSLGVASDSLAVPDLAGGWTDLQFRLTGPAGVPSSALCGIEIGPDDPGEPAFDAFVDGLTLLGPLFADGFESGDTSAWTATVP